MPQVLGGMGFSASGAYPFERMLRDSRILLIFEVRKRIAGSVLQGCPPVSDAAVCFVQTVPILTSLLSSSFVGPVGH